jgi:MFS family permease
MFCFFAAFLLLRAQTTDYLIARCCVERFNATACAADPQLQKRASVQQSAALRSMWVVVTQNAVAIPTTIVLTAASDHCGRKPVLLMSCGSLFVGSLGYIVVALLRPNVWWLVAPSLLMGVGGSYGTWNAAMFAATADGCASSHRSLAFSILESCIFLAGSLSPAAGGELMQRVSAVATFALISFFFLLALAFTLAMREPVAGASIRRARTVAPWVMALASVRLLRARGASHDGSSVGIVCAVFAAGYLSLQGITILLPLYAVEVAGFGPVAVGMLTSTNLVVAGLTLAILLPAALRCTSRRLHALVRVSQGALLVASVGAALLARCTDGTSLFMLYGASGLAYACLPTMRGLVSSLVGGDDQGKALGLVANIETFISTLAPVVWAGVYRSTVGWMPGFVYYVVGGTGGVALLLSLNLRAPHAAHVVSPVV